MPDRFIKRNNEYKATAITNTITNCIFKLILLAVLGFIIYIGNITLLVPDHEWTVTQCTQFSFMLIAFIACLKML